MTQNLPPDQQIAVLKRLLFDARQAETMTGARMEQVYRALAESVKLQSHYAKLLNMYDGGQRSTFTAEEWLDRVSS